MKAEARVLEIRASTLESSCLTVKREISVPLWRILLRQVAMSSTFYEHLLRQ